jgi:hypothetical protein
MANRLQKARKVGDGLHSARERRGLCRTRFIDNQETVVEAGAVLGVLAPGDSDVGAHAVAALDLCPPLAESGAVRPHAVADDSNQASILGKAQQGLLQVPGAVRRLALSLDAAGRRAKRRIKNCQTGYGLSGQDVVQLLGVLAGQRGIGKQICQEIPAPLGQLVENQVGAGEMGPDC